MGAGWRRFRRGVLACLVAVAVAVPAWAGPTYTVGVENTTYLPMYGVDERGRYTGAGRTLLDAFAREHAFSFDYVPLPVARLFRRFFKGGLDFKFPDHPAWHKDRREGLDIAYAEALRYMDAVHVPPGRAQEPPAAFDRVALPVGFSVLPSVRRAGIERHPMHEIDAMIGAALAGRVDGVFLASAVVNRRLDRMGREDALVPSRTMRKRGMYHLASQRHPAIVEKFARWRREHADLVARIRADWGLTRRR